MLHAAMSNETPPLMQHYRETLVTKGRTLVIALHACRARCVVALRTLYSV